jgi:hypothetical protein
MVNINLSLNLKNCANGGGKLPLRYDFEDKYFTLPLYFHGMGGYYLFFDPWTGQELICLYDHEFVESYEFGVKSEREMWEKSREKCFLHNSESFKRELSNFLRKFGPVDSKDNRKYWDNNIKECRDEHLGNGICHETSRFLQGGEEEGMTPIIHIPNIRTYAILKKKNMEGSKQWITVHFAELNFRIDWMKNFPRFYNSSMVSNLGKISKRLPMNFIPTSGGKREGYETFFIYWRKT